MAFDNPQTLFLASASPRRRDILTQLGFQVQVQSVNIDESRQSNESPRDYCVRLALQKNQAAVDRFQPDLPVIAADTIVVLGDETLGKPTDRETVIRTLTRLSDNVHQVITAVAVYHQDRVLHDDQVSEVHMAPIDSDWIASYADSEEPYDKAGAYGIQGAVGRWIKCINGSYSGIMGLPVYETTRLLTGLDIMSGKTL